MQTIEIDQIDQVDPTEPHGLTWIHPTQDQLRRRKFNEDMRTILLLVCGGGLLWFSFYFWKQFVLDKEWRVFLSMLSWVAVYSIYLVLAIFEVPAGKGWNMSNPFAHESNRLAVPSLGFRKIKAQKAYMSGYHIGFPWEKFAYEVDLAHKITVDNKKKGTSYTFKGGGTIEVEWRVRSAAHPEFLVNRTRTSEEDIALWLETRVDNFVAEYFGARTNADYGPNGERDFRIAFEHQFGGPWWVDDDEFSYGTITLTPEIIKMHMPKDQEKAKNMAAAFRTMRADAKQAVADNPGQTTYQNEMNAMVQTYILENLPKDVDPVVILGSMAGLNLRPKDAGNGGQGGGQGGGRRPKKKGGN